MQFGVIGGGLMGREIASSLGRWFALLDPPEDVELIAACDTDGSRREWFRRVPTVKQITADYKDLLANPDVDAVYVAVPHHLHEEIYSAVIQAGKDLLAEKPFGIDIATSHRLLTLNTQHSTLCRVSSEFPFYPGAQAAFEYCRNDNLGKLLEVRAGFWHSSDMDPEKPINWKRQSQFCGEIGVMGDLGLHVVHLPFRLGWFPERVYAQLQNVYKERPDGKGGMARCDTWDNATLNCTLKDGVPMRLEMKRLAPGEMNTWYFEALGTEGGVKYSTKEPKTLWTFDRSQGQAWIRRDVGHQPAFPVVTGAIFEFGFPDAVMQMLAAFAAEREGKLEGRFGCATPEEATRSHRLFEAALESHAKQLVVRPCLGVE